MPLRPHISRFGPERPPLEQEEVAHAACGRHRKIDLPSTHTVSECPLIVSDDPVLRVLIIGVYSVPRERVIKIKILFVDEEGVAACHLWGGIKAVGAIGEVSPVRVGG